MSLLDYNDFVGRIGIGRVFRGTVKVGDQVTLSKLDGTTKNFRVTKLFGFFGLERREIQEAKAGDLIAVSGMEDIFVGETITPTDAVEALPILHIDEPTLLLVDQQTKAILVVHYVAGLELQKPEDASLTEKAAHFR